MEIAGKNLVDKHPESRRFVPSIVQPLELSERSDSSKPGIQGEMFLAGRALLNVQAASGTADLVIVDPGRVDQAAAWISAKVAATLRRGAQDVGEYVLDTFFSGDPDLAKSKNPQKNASFRALAEKCGTPELPVSKTWLNNAVGVAVILRRLPEDAQAFKELPPSYQETLLPLSDPTKVEKVAKQAAAKDLSFRELRQAVAEERARTPKNNSRGRPRIPVVVKTLNRSLKLFAFGGSKRTFSKAEIQELDDKQRKAAKASAEELMGKLISLAVKLKKA